MFKGLGLFLSQHDLFLSQHHLYLLDFGFVLNVLFNDRLDLWPVFLDKPF